MLIIEKIFLTGRPLQRIHDYEAQQGVKVD